MREIRPYGSEGGGGETLPTPTINPNPAMSGDMAYILSFLFNPAMSGDMAHITYDQFQAKV